MRSVHNLFQSGCTNLHSYHQCLRVPFYHIDPALNIYCVLNKAIFSAVKGYLTVVLIFICLMINDLYTGVYWSSLCLSCRSVCFFFFLFFGVECMSSLDILYISTLLEILFENIFSHSVVGLYFVDSFFTVKKLLNLI